MGLVDRARRVAAGFAALVVMPGAGLVAMSAAPAHSASIVVTTTDDAGPGSLRAALAEAQTSPADDTITFASSVTGTILLTGGQLEADVGGSSGDLIIDGPGRDVLTVDAGGQSRVLDVRGPAGDTRPTVSIERLTLTGGFTGYGDDFREGGAIRAAGVDLALDRVVISDSRVITADGAGVHLQDGSLLLTASTVTGNTIDSDGFTGSGGGIFFDGGEAAATALTVHNSTVSDNTAGVSGGGIHSLGRRPVTVTASKVTDNTARSWVTYTNSSHIIGDGGGIWAGDLSLIDSTVTGNVAGSVGGGLHGQVVGVERSTIAHNVAHDYGGGIAAVGTHPDNRVRVGSSTVTGNRADNGGGLAVSHDTEVTLSTIAANAGVVGGGLFANGDVALQGTVVAMNSGGDLAGDGTAVLTSSLVQDPRSYPYLDEGGSITGQDPLLAPLADRGGLTETMLPGSTSPVIDRGRAFEETTDQRGSPRLVGEGADIGAVELSEAELAGPSQVASLERPTIEGIVEVGRTLRTDGGVWDQTVTRSYQWLRDGMPIVGATGASYTLTPDDYGWALGLENRMRISVVVSATAEGAAHRVGVAESDYTDRVLKGELQMSERPSVTGRTRVGEVLRARPRMGAVSPPPRGLNLRWFLDGRPVRGSFDERRLKLLPRMRGNRVSVHFSYRPPHAYERLSVTVRKHRRVR